MVRVFLLLTLFLAFSLSLGDGLRVTDDTFSAQTLLCEDPGNNPHSCSPDNPDPGFNAEYELISLSYSAAGPISTTRCCQQPPHRNYRVRAPPLS